jgi:FixJ family two-component response regulator
MGQLATKAVPVVCIVDDDPSVRRALRRLLKSAGLRARTFASAGEFLGAGGASVCDCLILDVRMPGIDGLQLQAHLAASGSSVPILFISGHDDPEAAAQALAAGAAEFFDKPVDDEALLGAIRRVVSRAGKGIDGETQ